MSKYVCTICGYVHDEEEGYPEGGIAPNTPWSEVPDTFACPICGALKEDFKKEEEEDEIVENSGESTHLPDDVAYTTAELSAIFSNLSKGAEKQYDIDLSKLYNNLSEYYSQNNNSEVSDLNGIKELVDSDLSTGFKAANEVALKHKDRGAQRALKWSEQVTRMINSHLKKIATGSTKFLEDSNLYVCEICGYIHIGKSKPDICPVCKVPSSKLTQIKREA